VAFPTSIDPTVRTDFSSTRAQTHVYDTLVYPDYDSVIQPSVAESWTISDDGITYTFTLKEGLVFHDLTEIKAEDVEFSMNRLLDTGGGWASNFLPYVESVEVLDEYVVEFKLKLPYSPFLWSLTRLHILNKDLIMDNLVTPGAYDEYGDYGQEYLTEHDAGSGPYKVKEFRLEEVLILELFEDYWGEIKPRAPKELHQIGTTEPMTIRTMMSNRELEISDQWQSPEAFAALDEIPGVDVADLMTGSHLRVLLNNQRAPTDDVHFRRALSYLMDYTQVAELWPGSAQLKGPVPDNIAGFNPDVDYYTYNLEKAQEELQQSKYYDQLDEIELDFWWVSEVPLEEKIAIMFASAAEEAGINVKVTKQPWLACVEASRDKEICPNAIPMIGGAAYPEAGSYFETYHSRWAATNFIWHEDPEIDTIIEDILSTSDTNERFQKYYDFQEIALEEAWVIWTLQIPEQHAYQTDYIDWPAANGQVIPLMGANDRWNLIELYPEMIP
jgi:peptide/nickel transport system substrate-binding protein